MEVQRYVRANPSTHHLYQFLDGLRRAGTDGVDDGYFRCTGLYGASINFLQVAQVTARAVDREKEDPHIIVNRVLDRVR